VYVQLYYNYAFRTILTIKHSSVLTLHQSAVCCHADGSVSCDVATAYLYTVYVPVMLQVTKRHQSSADVTASVAVTFDTSPGPTKYLKY